jgi:hypothetical protein
MLSHKDSTTRSRSRTGNAVNSVRVWSMSIMASSYQGPNAMSSTAESQLTTVACQEHREGWGINTPTTATTPGGTEMYVS